MYAIDGFDRLTRCEKVTHRNLQRRFVVIRKSSASISYFAVCRKKICSISAVRLSCGEPVKKGRIRLAMFTDIVFFRDVCSTVRLISTQPTQQLSNTLA